MIILKVTKKQGFILSLEDTFFEKPQGGGGQIDSPHPSRFRVNKELVKQLFKPMDAQELQEPEKCQQFWLNI